MGTAGKHQPMIERDRSSGAPRNLQMFRARCSCGWRSIRAVASPEMAERDHIFHLQDEEHTG